MKVSILVPVYGVEKYIRKCMLSVLDQTFKDDIEILAIDDLGPDKSIEIPLVLAVADGDDASIICFLIASKLFFICEESVFDFIVNSASVSANNEVTWSPVNPIYLIF